MRAVYTNPEEGLKDAIRCIEDVKAFYLIYETPTGTHILSSGISEKDMALKTVRRLLEVLGEDVR